MKQKEIGTDSQSQWEDRIIRDLNYIREKKHYRWTQKTWLPVLFALVWFGFAAYSVTISFRLAHEAGRTPGYLSRFLIPVISIYPLTVAVSKYFRSLFFINITTGLSKQNNHDMLVEFLSQKQLLVYYHPKTSDVVQIISRPLSSNDDRREAIVFIIDENGILINSHFTNSGWRLTISARHHKQMANELKSFMKYYQPTNGKTVSKW